MISVKGNFIGIAVLAAAVICLSPVSGVVYPAPTSTPATAGAAPYVTATVSAASVPAGTPVTVSGISSGPGSVVQVWAFGGNYVSVSTVPLGGDGTYTKTFETTNLPAATYFIFVQNPGSDSRFGITMNGDAGTVMNEKTGAVIFNFTGTGSVRDSAAATALSDALGTQGGDDSYTRARFVVTGGGPAAAPALPGSDRDAHGCIGSAGYTWCEAKQTCLREWEEPCTGAAAAATTPAAAAPAATKSPLPVGTAIAGIAISCSLVAIRNKR